MSLERGLVLALAVGWEVPRVSGSVCSWVQRSVQKLVKEPAQEKAREWAVQRAWQRVETKGSRLAKGMDGPSVENLEVSLGLKLGSAREAVTGEGLVLLKVCPCM